jgi:hypothetical protein
MCHTWQNTRLSPWDNTLEIDQHSWAVFGISREFGWHFQDKVKEMNETDWHVLRHEFLRRRQLKNARRRSPSVCNTFFQTYFLEET